MPVELKYFVLPGCAVLVKKGRTISGDDDNPEVKPQDIMRRDRMGVALETEDDAAERLDDLVIKGKLEHAELSTAQQRRVKVDQHDEAAATAEVKSRKEARKEARARGAGNGNGKGKGRGKGKPPVKVPGAGAQRSETEGEGPVSAPGAGAQRSESE